MRPKSPRKWGGLALLLAILIVAIGGGLATLPGEASAPAQGEKPAGRTLNLPGKVVAAEQAELHALVAGVVQKIPVELGDRVKAGQVLVEVAAPELEVELVKARAL